jgi:membrane-associated protease RseP (regulator of RpoE activity)
VLSVLYTGAYGMPGDEEAPLSWATLMRGWRFAGPLLAILLAHEFGHYVAARRHGVPTSLPFFLPMPLLSPFGTWGAIIAMPERIASRRALVDIGAAGPIAGMFVALPVLSIGLALSDVAPLTPHGAIEGQCLLYSLLKWLVIGPIADGSDVYLHPMAFAGWAGLFVTMINLLPFGQLDGGHIAYALLGPRQDKVALWVRRALLPLFAWNLTQNLLHARAAGYAEGSLSAALSSSVFWLFWFGILSAMGYAAGFQHPPTEPGESLGPARTAIAWGSLVLFALLFMPAPFTVR